MARESDEEFDAAMESRPGWVKWAWATPARRLGLSIVFLGIAIWIIVSALTDPDYFHNYGAIAGLAASPLLLVMFGAQLVQSVADLVRGRNSRPVFHRIGRWLDQTLLRRR